MRPTRVRAAAAVALATGLAAIGCAGGGPPFAEVGGTVARDGKPLANVRVEFWPDGDGPTSAGVTDAAGLYALKADDGRAGAVVGGHRVVLRDLDMLGSKFVGRKGESVADLSGGKKPRLPAAWADATKTPLRKSVAAGAKNTIDIDAK